MFTLERDDTLAKWIDRRKFLGVLSGVAVTLGAALLLWQIGNPLTPGGDRSPPDGDTPPPDGDAPSPNRAPTCWKCSSKLNRARSR